MVLNLKYRNKKAIDIHQGKWNGLGGKFEPGETLEECVIREVLEESDLTVRNPKYCGWLMFPKFKGNNWYVFVFTAAELSGELIDSQKADSFPPNLNTKGIPWANIMLCSIRNSHKPA
jgi:8-oxo-dGTP diphosphatase